MSHLKRLLLLCTMLVGIACLGVAETAEDGTPELSIALDDGSSNEMDLTVIDVQVAAGSDDAEESSSDGTIGLDSSDLELITDGTEKQFVGMRFNNLQIPSQAIITNAYIQFQVDNVKNIDGTLSIRAEDVDNATTFTTEKNDISNRVLTYTSVDWAPAAWTTAGDAGDDQRSPDLSVVIQEVVDRAGWSEGNSMSIIISGTGQRVAESYDGDSSGAPTLHVEFELDGNAPPTAVAGSDQTVSDTDEDGY